ncbi:MAG: MarR family transcriptional regulator [Oscillospiraceae bacterium]
MPCQIRIGREVRILSHLIRRYVDTLNAVQYAKRVTGIHGWVLGYLRANETHEIFQRDLEREFSVRRSTATTILQLMEKNGLITRSPVAYDARLKRIELTVESLNILEMVETQLDAAESLLIKDIPPGDLDIFVTTLEKMKNNLTEIQP